MNRRRLFARGEGACQEAGRVGDQGVVDEMMADEISQPGATAELRRLVGFQVFTQRLASELRADTLRWSAKTGTFLHLRHEIGVVEAESGDRVAMAALTRADRRPAWRRTSTSRGESAHGGRSRRCGGEGAVPAPGRAGAEWPVVGGSG